MSAEAAIVPVGQVGDNDRGGGNSSDPLTSETILSKVLQYLDFEELLVVRQVNRFWNKQAVKILKEHHDHQYHVSLNELTIFQYGKLLRETNKFPIPSICKKMYINVEGKPGQKNFDPALDCIIRLVGHFGPESVESLKLNGNTQSFTLLYINMLKTAELLQRISIGLKHLHLLELLLLLDNKPPGPTNISFLSFPQLTTLHFGLGCGNFTLLTQILNTAPKLESLTSLSNMTEFVTLVIYGNGLVKSGHFPPLRGVVTVSKHIQEMKLDVYNVRTLNGLKDIRFAELQKLHLVFIYELPERLKSVLARFLRNNCPKLNSLEFTFLRNSVILEYGVIFPTLPSLPNITTLEYNVSQCVHMGIIRIFNKREDTIPPSEKFPGLRTVKTHLGAHFVPYEAGIMMRPYNNRPEGPWYNNPAVLYNMQFPTVETLVYKIPKVCLSVDRHLGSGREVCCGISARDTINQLKVLYPNVKKLVIENEIDAADRRLENGHDYNIDIKISLKFLLQELGHGLIELEISNYFKDWFSEIFEENPAIAINGLNSLKIIGKETNGRIVRDVTCKVDLNVIMKGIPYLKHLHITPELLLGEDRQNLAKVLIKYKTMYQDLEIELL